MVKIANDGDINVLLNVSEVNKNYKYKEDEDRGYIYTLYIDIEKDKPEEIGQKIIDLYNLLKEKITQ